MPTSPAIEIDRSSGRTWLLAALGLSLLAHAVLLLLPGFSNPPDRSSTRLSVEIRRPSVPSRPDEMTPTDTEERVEPAPEPAATTEPEPPPAPVTEPTPRSEPPEQPPQEQSLVETDDSDPGNETPAMPLSTQLLTAVRANLGGPAIPDAPDALTPATVPDLPDAPGWIDHYVGTVDSRVEQWTNADGTRESRIVTASGQVFCGRARAPTTAELFNPQFAMNIMLFRDCGRERPPAVDRNDPWVRAPRSDREDDRP